MAELAIKGHTDRGNEVIEILEMLGGLNVVNYKGNGSSWYYIIKNNYIEWCHECIPESNFISFTLEEFLKKFPYKVGDKVNAPCKGCIKTITSMEWDTYLNEVTYKLDNREYTNMGQLKVVNDLKPYKEETMETITIDDFKANTKEWLIDKLHNMIISNAIKTIGDIHDELHKPEYPKTYEECCEVLGYKLEGVTVIGYDAKLIAAFQRLKVCRDAYWKIAGEQMGLGKPWEPDWTNNYQKKWIINFYQGKINLTNGTNVHFVLAFPTEEMRDAFYENFRELIEECKELL